MKLLTYSPFWKYDNPGSCEWGIGDTQVQKTGTTIWKLDFSLEKNVYRASGCSKPPFDCFDRQHIGAVVGSFHGLMEVVCKV